MRSTPRLKTCCGVARGSPRFRMMRRSTSRSSRRPSRPSSTSSPGRAKSRWRSEARGPMTQQSVEILIGKLLTDEELREAFEQNPQGVLVWLLRRSEEHTSELQSPCNLVCRLLLEKKKKQRT